MASFLSGTQGEPAEAEDACDACYRALAVMSAPPARPYCSAFGTEETQTACWWEMQATRKPVGVLDTEIPF
jgi:hypothetical protein